MRPKIHDILGDRNANVRGKIVGIYLLLAIFNAGAWLWAILAFRMHSVLLGTAFLAYSFGLRHAVDADHIAAIDNVTRKLMQEGKRPVAVGLMFSLGHSTIVVIGSLLIALTTLGLQRRTHVLQHIGGLLEQASRRYSSWRSHSSTWLSFDPCIEHFLEYDGVSRTLRKTLIFFLPIAGFSLGSSIRCSTSSVRAGTCIPLVSCSDLASILRRKLAC